jgi:hypothetical protein
VKLLAALVLIFGTCATAGASTVLPIELEIIDEINLARIDNGLDALGFDSILFEGSRFHADDMRQPVFFPTIFLTGHISMKITKTSVTRRQRRRQILSHGQAFSHRYRQQMLLMPLCSESRTETLS